jgi:hypothetical protein
MKRAGWLAAPGLWFLYAACSGGSPPPASTAPTPVAQQAPAPASAAPVVQVEPPDSGSADAAAAKAKPAPASGRSMVRLEGMTTPQTIASGGAIMILDNGAELRIPVDSLLEARNILMTVDRKGRPSAGKVGDVFDITVQVPGLQYRIGEEAASTPVKTQGGPFVIKLPLPAGTKSASLAIETVTIDPKKTGKAAQKSTWKVVSMTKIEEADTGNKAVFEMDELPDGHVHLTTAAPTPDAGGQPKQ